jgi:hypothetical protein
MALSDLNAVAGAGIDYSFFIMAGPAALDPAGKS